MASFDNKVLIDVLKCLKAEGRTQVIHLRFHPLARLTSREHQWIDRNVKEGWLILTGKVPLKEDLGHAKIVVGMGTTVLEEALLLGVPVLHIQHPDYVQYIHLQDVHGATLINWDLINADALHKAAKQTQITNIRHRFGLQFPIVDYARFFASEAG